MSVAVPSIALWGGREGYDTQLNTDVGRELDQLGRFLTMVVEHKHAGAARMGGERLAMRGCVSRACSLRSRAARATASLNASAKSS